MQLGNIEHNPFPCKGHWIVLTTHSPRSTMIVDSQFKDTKSSHKHIPVDEGDLDQKNMTEQQSILQRCISKTFEFYFMIQAGNIANKLPMTSRFH